MVQASASKNRWASKGIPIQWFKENHIELRCHYCKKELTRFSKAENGEDYLHNRFIYENTAQKILLVFHNECKKAWIAHGCIK